MTRLIRFLLLLLAFLPLSQTYASHMAGAEINWKKIGQDSFQITVRAYKDCNGTQIGSSGVLVTPTVCPSFSIGMKKVQTIDITPTCTNQCNRCKGSGCSLKYGYEYTDFEGLLIASSLRKNGCCKVVLSFTDGSRNNSITTGAAGSGFYVESTLNICELGDNSSPIFSEHAPNIVCIQSDVVFNSGAADSDRDSITGKYSDSLVYRFTPPKSNQSTFTTWQGKFDYNLPIYFSGFPKATLALPRGLHLNPTTGVLKFRPMSYDVTIMAIKVEEFRKGKKIGEVTRELQIVVVSCTKNSPPVISGIKNTPKNSFKINTCPGKEVCFYVDVTDNDRKDSLFYQYKTNVPGLKNKNRTFLQSDTIKFCFKPDSPAIKDVYYIDLAIEDNSCPLIGRTFQRIEVNMGNEIMGKFYLKTKHPACERYILEAKNDDFPVTDTVYWYRDGVKIGSAIGPFKTNLYLQGQYQFEGIIQNCITSKVSGNIGVNSDKALPILSGVHDTSICFGDSLAIPLKIKSSSEISKMTVAHISGDSINAITFVDTNLFAFKYNNLLSQPADFQMQLIAENKLNCRAMKLINVRVKPQVTLNKFSDIKHCVNVDKQFALPKIHAKSFWTGQNVQNDTFHYVQNKKPFHQTLIYNGLTDTACYSDSLNFLVPKVLKTTWQSDTTLCIGSSDISIMAEGKGSWKGRLTIDPTDDRKATFDPSSVGEFKLLYEKTAEQIENCELSGAFIVTVTDKANPIIISDTTLCVNTENILLKSQNQGTWYGAGVENDSEFNPSATGSYSIFFDPSDAKACLKKDSITITVVENTNQISIVDTFSACGNDRGENSLIGNTKNGSWKGLGAASNTSTLHFIPSHFAYGHYDFVYTDRDETYNCAISDTTVVEIIRMPKINISILQDKVELGQTFKIQNSGNTKYQYEWIINGSSEGHTFDFEPEVIMDSLGIFDVKIIAIDPRTSCSDTLIRIDAIEVVDPNSIGTPHFSKLINLCPNPTSDQITIENHGIQTIQLELYDLSGKIVKSLLLKSGQSTIDLSELAKGFYQAQFNLGNSRWMEKVVKK